MNWETIITGIFQLCLIPLLGILTKYLISFISIKGAEIQKSTDSQLTAKYVKMASETISACVIATNQTYVNSLKEQGKFDKKAQEVAFHKTLDAVLAILSDEVKTYLTSAFGDLDIYLMTQIEASVNAERKE